MAGKADLVNSIVDPFADLASPEVAAHDADPFGVAASAALAPGDSGSMIDPDGARAR
ncbi:MAG TPA: hypothetical protein VFJ16_05285 [Longimicrobium sp.]|nr:hypothetical protein [Longimicrobium sp.]